MLLGNTIFGGFTPLIKKFLNSTLIGSNNDALLDAVLYTNMTPYGVFSEQQDSMQRRMANRQVADLTRASRSQWFEATAKTLMSYEDWSKNNTGTLEDYEAFMHNRAEGFADNKALAWLLDTVGFDPDNIAMARTYLGKAGSNITRLRKGAGDRAAFAASRATRNLFMNEDGQIDYNKEDYGFMTMGETAAVVAALTRDMDFFNTPDVTSLGSNVEKIKQATNNIKKAAQDYTNALSPLKDVFGSDIPKMIQSLEQMTGQRLTQMSAEAVGDATRRIMAGAEAGRYQLQQLTTVRQQVSGAITQMGVPFINDISATEQAQTILGITNTGLVPSSMSANRFEQLAADRVMRTSNSRGATALNQAYALWREEQERNGETFATDQQAFETFRTAYQQLREDGMAVDNAILELSGKDNMYQLQDALGSQYYQTAVRRNLGGSMAMQESTNQRIQQARYDAAQNNVQPQFDEAINALQKDITLLNANEETLRSSGLSNEAQWQIRAIRNGRYGDLGAVMSANQAAIDTERRTQQTATIRAFTEAMQVDLASSKSDLIGRFMNVRRKTQGGLPTTESIREILSESATLKGADPDTMATAVTMLQATDQILTYRGVTDETQAQEIAKDWLTYVNKDGMYNARFLDAMNSYQETAHKRDVAMASAEEAEKKGDTYFAERQRALAGTYEQELVDMVPKMYIARYANEDLYDQFTKEKGRETDLLYAIRNGEYDAAEVNDYMKAYIARDKLMEAAGKMQNSDYLKQAMSDETFMLGAIDEETGLRKGGLLQLANEEDSMTSEQMEEWFKNTDAGKLMMQTNPNIAKDIFNTVVEKSESTTKTQTDLFDMLGKLDGTLKELSGVMDQVKKELSSKEVQNANTENVEPNR